MKFALKLSTLLSLVLAVISASMLFWVSQKVQEKERETAQLQDKLNAEQESLRVLQAEWDYLNRPDRLEELASKYLDMKSITVDNLVQSVSNIPEPEDITIPPDVIDVATGENKKEIPTDKKTLNDVPSPDLGGSDVTQENDFNAVLDDATKNNGEAR